MDEIELTMKAELYGLSPRLLSGYSDLVNYELQDGEITWRVDGRPSAKSFIRVVPYLEQDACAYILNNTIGQRGLWWNFRIINTQIVAAQVTLPDVAKGADVRTNPDNHVFQTSLTAAIDIYDYIDGQRINAMTFEATHSAFDDLLMNSEKRVYSRILSEVVDAIYELWQPPRDGIWVKCDQYGKLLVKPSWRYILSQKRNGNEIVFISE